MVFCYDIRAAKHNSGGGKHFTCITGTSWKLFNLLSNKYISFHIQLFTIIFSVLIY